MKTIKTSLIATLVLFTLIFAGCGTVSHEYQQVDATTGKTNIVYDVTPQFSNTVAQIKQYADQIPQTGIAPIDLGKDVLLGVLSLATGALTLVNRVRTQAANNHAAAADVLAGVVTKNNLSTQALQNAGTVASTVAQHIDNNTIS